MREKDSLDLTVIEELEPKIAPGGGETWDGLHPECRPCKVSRENERKRRRRAAMRLVA